MVANSQPPRLTWVTDLILSLSANALVDFEMRRAEVLMQIEKMYNKGVLLHLYEQIFRLKDGASMTYP